VPKSANFHETLDKAAQMFYTRAIYTKDIFVQARPQPAEEDAAQRFHPHFFSIFSIKGRPFTLERRWKTKQLLPLLYL
jgi:hypothetical protein